MKIEDVKIDPEFKSLIEDGHTPQQLDELKADIAANGFLDTAIVWKQEKILLDGHTRYGIWEADYKGKSAAAPRVAELSFASRTEAKRWVILHQLSRRNLNPTRAAYYRGMLYNELKLDQLENLTPGPKTASAKSEHPKETAEKTSVAVAKQTGVGASTVRADAKFAEAVNRIAAVNSKAAADIKDGKLADKKTAIAVAKLPDDQIGKALGNIRNGREWKEGIEVTKPIKATADLAESYLDDERNEVPEELFPVWRERDRFMKLAGKIKSLHGEIDELKKSPAGRCVGQATKLIEDAGKSLAMAMPSVVSGKKWKSVGEAAK